MRKSALIITGVALASFLIGTMLSTNYLAMGGAKPNPVWEAIYDLQAKVNNLNSTVIEQQAQISELQTQVDILNATKLGTPDYDSGWVTIDGPNWQKTLQHNLNTRELLVYCVCKTNMGEIVQTENTQNLVYWRIISDNEIALQTPINPNQFWLFRVMLWKSPSP